jgi:citrate lyase subunit beta/citryl-CoA lyase
MDIRPRRSVLFVPASNARMVEKARTLPCDVVVLDLEDAVAPEQKEIARTNACAAADAFGKREVVIRINALSSAWGKYDLAAARSARPDAILLPKVVNAADIAAVKFEIPLWAMIETPMAVLNVAAIAAAGTACLVLGTNDLINDMHAQPLADRRNLWPVLSQTVLAARAHGAAVIDGTHNEIADDKGFAAACAQGKAFGFDGKTLIHPGQVEAANRIFAPSQDEIAAARRILAAFEQPENRGKGAIALDGRMVERLHADNAARLLALAAAIAERG